MIQFKTQMSAYNGKIALPRPSGLLFCYFQEILFCKAEGNNTVINMVNGEAITIARTLKSFENVLKPFPFFRVHQSYLINLQFIVEYVKSSGGFIIMENEVEIPISRNRKKEFFGAIEFMMIK